MKKIVLALIGLIGAYLFLLILFSTLIFTSTSKAINSLQSADFNSAADSTQTASNLLKLTQILTSPFPFTRDFIQIVDQSLDFIVLSTKAASSSEQMFTAILGQKPKDFSQSHQELSSILPQLKLSLSTLKSNLSTLKTQYPAIQSFKPLNKLSQLDQINYQLDIAQTWLPLLPDIFGTTNKKSYLILFQNNFELRPTGGFMGSYARVDFDSGTLAQIQVKDIYVPDGQLTGYVKEPKPISQYLFDNQTPGWRLRDANWNPDFVEAASDINWFFDKGKEPPNDGLIAINLFTIHQLLKITGPIEVFDYQETIDADNFYQKTQNYSEVDFFPGSIQKQSFLSSFSKQLIEKIKTVNPKQQLQIYQTLISHLNQKQIMFAFDDPTIAAKFHQSNWDGHIKNPTCDQPNCINNYLYLVEANLGVNKANCCLDRTLTHQVNLSNFHQATQTLNITYTNHNLPTQKPPRTYGGGYKNYLRLILPTPLQLNEIKVGNEVIKPQAIDITQSKNHTTIGFLASVPASETKTITVSYTQPISLNYSQPINYQFTIQKQSGIDTLPYSTEIFFNQDQLFSSQNDIKTDTIINTTFSL